MMNFKKALYALMLALFIGIVASIYASITAKPEPQQPITRPSEYITNEVNINPEKY